jgi:type IV pilus assembly protein PilA
MMSRKKGFSLVELLIVLAVMAALIATITPVALNAIKKSKATQVAQNLKTLASAIENAAYVNGVNDNHVLKAGTTTPIVLSDLGRDIDPEKYGVWYTGTSNKPGEFEVLIFYKGTDVDAKLVNQTMPNATDTKPNEFDSIAGDNQLGSKSLPNTKEGIFYTLTFSVY